MDVHELRAKGGIRLRVRDISSEVPRQLTRSLIHKEIRHQILGERREGFQGFGKEFVIGIGVIRDDHFLHQAFARTTNRLVE